MPEDNSERIELYRQRAKQHLCIWTGKPLVFNEHKVKRTRKHVLRYKPKGAMVTKQCEFCGASFTVFNKYACKKYCTELCSRREHRRRKKVKDGKN